MLRVYIIDKIGYSYSPQKFDLDNDWLDLVKELASIHKAAHLQILVCVLRGVCISLEFHYRTNESTTQHRHRLLRR